MQALLDSKSDQLLSNDQTEVQLFNLFYQSPRSRKPKSFTFLLIKHTLACLELDKNIASSTVRNRAEGVPGHGCCN